MVGMTRGWRCWECRSSGETNSLLNLLEVDSADKPISDAGKKSGFQGMAERRAASVRGSELPGASKSLEKIKGDEEIAVRGRGEETSRGKEKKRRIEPRSRHSGSDWTI